MNEFDYFKWCSLHSFQNSSDFKNGEHILAPYDMEVIGATGCCIVNTKHPVPADKQKELTLYQFRATSDNSFTIPLFYNPENNQ